MKGTLALLAASLLVCAIAAELALRLVGFGQPLIHDYDPELLWVLPGDSTAYSPSHGVSYRMNSRGWRDDEIPAEPAPGEIRILALGDSVLFGHGVPFDEIFSERLEALLARATGAPRVEVINTGISGYGIPQYRVILERAVAEFAPDLVLVLLVKNDVVSAQDVEELRENARTGRQDNVDTPRIRARRASALFHAVDGVALRLFPAAPPPRALRFDRAEIGADAWSHSIALFEDMLDLVEARDIPLVVAVLPLAREIGDVPEQVDVSPLEQLSRSRGFPLLPLQSVFAGRSGEDLFLDAVHPSSRGHEIAAQAVAAWLVEQGLLSPR
jgi:lysophospholipase L1-like esterase